MPCDTAGLGSSPFARRYLGNRSYFLFLRVLRCFSSPRSPPADRRVTESLPPGCPIRRSTGQWVFAPRRGLSQLVTSFFASESQGIPHAPLVDSVISLTSSAKLHLSFCHLTFTSVSPQADGSARLEFSITLVILSFLLCVFSLTSALMSQRSCFQPCHCSLFLVEDIGFEPMTPCLQSRCSSQLS